jgi:hypothetical protein
MDRKAFQRHVNGKIIACLLHSYALLCIILLIDLLLARV